MSATYTPAANQLVSLTVPSDGDLRNVASVNLMTKALADGIAYLGAHLVALTLNESVDQNTAAGTSTNLVVPATCTNMIVEMWGGGGGGGSGAPGASTFFQQNTGGGGGGGAHKVFGIFQVGNHFNPGDSIRAFTAGAAPGGLFTGGVALAGTRGADSYLQNITAGTELLRGRGGAPGYGGSNIDAASNYVPSTASANVLAAQYSYVRGGHDGASLTTATRNGFATNVPWEIAEPRMYCGGFGTCAQLANVAALALAIYGSGGCSAEGFSGGQPGSAGAPYGTPSSSGIWGGGAGGGGGAGPRGVGGKGGNGTNGVNGGTPLTGGAGLAGGGPGGTQATMGTGGGGGGGGGAGGGGDYATPGSGGNGGAGGGGTTRIWFMGPV